MLKLPTCFFVFPVVVGVTGCVSAQNCPVAPRWADWEGTDTEGNYLNCNCGGAPPEDSGFQFQPGIAWCDGGMFPRPGCGAYDLGTADLSADPIVLSYSFDPEEYSYTLTAEQRTELRAACGLE